MSKIITVTGRPAAASRSMTRLLASAKPRRLSMPLNGSIDAAVLCTVTARSDTSMKMTNTVPIAYRISSTENTVTQMLLVKVSSCGRSRLPSRIGSTSTQPCINGTTIAGQRFAWSGAARPTIRTPSARHRSPRSLRRWAAAWSNPSDGMAATAPIQTIAPSSSPGRLGLRPWKIREAFQTMPQATKPSACSASKTGSPSMAPPRSRARPTPHRANRPCPTISGLKCFPVCRTATAWPRACLRPSWRTDTAWKYRTTWAHPGACDAISARTKNAI